MCIIVLLIVLANRSGSDAPLPASLTGQMHENGENTHDTFLSPLRLIDYTFADWHGRLVSSQKIVQLLVSYLFVHNSTIQTG